MSPGIFFMGKRSPLSRKLLGGEGNDTMNSRILLGQLSNPLGWLYRSIKDNLQREENSFVCTMLCANYFI